MTRHRSVAIRWLPGLVRWTTCLAAAAWLAAAPAHGAAPPANAPADTLAGAAAPEEAPAAGAEAAPEAFLRIHDALREVAPDPARVAEVTDLRLRREAARLHLEQGTLALLEPVEGREVGAVFTGRATLRFRPPVAVERRQLRRVFGSDSLAMPLESVVLLATDSLVDELRGELSFAPGSVPDGAGEAVQGMVSRVQRDGGEVVPGVLSAFVRRPVRPWFRAHVEPRDGDPFAVTVDLRQREEVRLSRDMRGGGNFEVVSQFHRDRDYEERDAVGRATEEAGHALSVRRYEMDVSLDGNQNLDARATLELAPRDGAGSWVPFRLHDGLSVDSARWEDGSEAAFHRFDGSPWLWVRLPPGTEGAGAGDGAPAGDEARAGGDETPAGGEPLRLRLRYHGDVVSHRRGWFFLESPTGWYPRHGESHSAFDLTFRTEDEFPVVSVGKKLSEREEDGRVVTRWRTREPALHASFAVGRLTKHEIRNPVVPPVNVYIDLVAHRELEQRTGGRLWSRDNMDELVGGDLVNALGVFRRWFGPVGDETLRVAEIPYGHGQAFPGLIHMSWVTFQRLSRDDADEMFRAHEVAHQWWGLEVRPRTYHDAWLSEGFAEYASVLYLGAATGDTAKYMEHLRGIRDAVLDRRGEAGPVWLGPRVTVAGEPEDYGTVVYGKGAWVVHMLWGLLLDEKSIDVNRFRTMLRDLYATYRGRQLSTAEFQQHVERHADRELDWFFDQWVRGTRIPTYRVGYSGSEGEDGYYVEVRVEQEKVPPDFRMSVPVAFRVEGDGGTRWRRFRMEVTGRETTARLGPLPERPEEVVFNAFEAVLAEVDDQGWQDG